MYLFTLDTRMRCLNSKAVNLRCVLVIFFLCYTALHVEAFPSPVDYPDRDYASPGAHQLASWLTSQLRAKEYVAPIDVPIIPYRLPVQGKRNSEMSNAIIGSEETQKMYRDGRR